MAYKQGFLVVGARLELRELESSFATSFVGLLQRRGGASDAQQPVNYLPIGEQGSRYQQHKSIRHQESVIAIQRMLFFPRYHARARFEKLLYHSKRKGRRSRGARPATKMIK